MALIPALDPEAIEFEEALTQLSAVTGWDYDHTLNLVLTVARDKTDSALTIARWLTRHASEGATITLDGNTLKISVTLFPHTPLRDA